MCFVNNLKIYSPITLNCHIQCQCVHLWYIAHHLSNALSQCTQCASRVRTEMF